MNDFDERGPLDDSIVEPETEVVADLTAEPDDDLEPEVEDDPEPEEAPAEPDPEPEDDELEPDSEPEADEPADGSVTFICDQWQGVSLHGKDIKFEGGRFTTSDTRKIAVLDAWEHARREG